MFAKAALVLLATVACSASSPGSPSPPVSGFRFAIGGSNHFIEVDAPVRCYEAARALYVLSPDSYPSPPSVRDKVVNLIIAGFHGAGSYTIAEGFDDPNSVLVMVLDYAGPSDYTILGRGVSGSIRIASSGDHVIGHVEGAMRGSVDSVQGDWTCRLSSPPAGSASATALPSAP